MQVLGALGRLFAREMRAAIGREARDRREAARARARASLTKLNERGVMIFWGRNVKSSWAESVS
jgi:CRP-like cAMP-binding protein